MTTDNIRQVCTEPITCKHCGYLPEEFVEYFDGVGWCSLCAESCGLIDDSQREMDNKENMEAYMEYLECKLRSLKSTYRARYG